MSKKLSYQGILDMGVQQKINLATLNGKTGYKITKFQTITEKPGYDQANEIVCKIYSKSQTTFPAEIDFSEGDLLAAAYYEDNVSSHEGVSKLIIFDNKIFNQNIFVYAEDAEGGSARLNYHIELETVALTDIQSTQLTLKNLRTIASR